MGRVKIHRSWPCGYQESVQAEGWGLSPSITEESLARPCPNCGGVCLGKGLRRD